MSTVPLGAFPCRPDTSFFGKAEAKKGPSKGMQLGKAKKGANDFLDSLRAEGELVDTNNGYTKDSGGAAGPPAAKAPTDPLSIAAEEKVRAVLNNNGGVEELEVNGTISLQVVSVVPAATGSHYPSSLSLQKEID